MSIAVRVLLCDDHAPTRARARVILESSGRFEVVGEAADAAAGVAMARELRPQLVLMDVLLPDFPGFEATRRILAADPGVKILAFSSEARWQTAQEMFAAGASGYVVKNGNETELLLGSLTVISGGFFITPEIQPGKHH